MTVANLLQILSDRSVSVRIDGENLRLKPAENIPPGLMSKLRDAKADILSLIPPGWPEDVPIPSWWAELVGGFPDGFLLQARRTVCSDSACKFPIAVRWQDHDKTVRWSCPQCGRDHETISTDSEQVSTDSEYPRSEAYI